MKLVTVIPLTKSSKTDELSYFTAKDIAPGDIVTVPLRKKEVPGLVIGIEDVEESKTTLKKNDFQMKKISSVKGPSGLHPALLQTIESVKDYFAAGSSSIFKTILPRFYLENIEKLKKNTEPFRSIDTSISPEKIALQESTEDRRSFFKTYIRESFAKRESVIVLLPTIREVERFEHDIKRGIDTRVISLHSGYSDTELIERYNKIITSESSLLIVSTSSFLFIPRHDIGTIVIECESNPAYKTIARTPYDFRIIAESYANHLGAVCILSDTFLRPDTIERKIKKEVSEKIPFNYRPIPRATFTILDRSKGNDLNPEEKVPYRYITEQAEEKIRHHIQKKNKIFLFGLRTGLAPLTVCHDCGDTLICKKCEAPLVLVSKAKKRLYICNRCGHEEDSTKACERCGSWNLVPLGIGIERIVESVAQLFPEQDIIQFDGITIKTPKQAAQALKLFEESDSAIMVGTEMALPYLSHIDCTIIVSFDSLFSVANYKIYEKVIRIVSTLSEKTEKDFLIQTKHADDPVLTGFSRGSLNEFYKQELKDRQVFGYPPFNRIIKITEPVKGENLKEMGAHYKKLFSGYDLESYTTPISKERGIYALHGIMRHPADTWNLPELSSNTRIDRPLLEKLRSLPPQVRIEIDPEQIL